MSDFMKVSSYWFILALIVVTLLLVGLLSLTPGWGGLASIYYEQICGPALEKTYGFELGALPSGSNLAGRYVGFVSINPNGSFAQAGVKQGDLLANEAWIYHAAEKEGLYRLLSSGKPGQEVTFPAISASESVGLAPLGWHEKAKVIKVIVQ